MRPAKRSDGRWWVVTFVVTVLVIIGAALGATWSTNAATPLTLSELDSSAVVTCQNIANDNWVGFTGTERCYHEISHDFLKLADTKLTSKQLRDLHSAANNCAANASDALNGFEACMKGVTGLAKAS